MDIGSIIDQIEQQRKEQDAIYHGVALRHGLSDTALWVLYILSVTEGDCTQQNLIHQCFFSKQTVNTAVTGLVKRGYLTLEMIPGTRNLKRLLLTQAGEALAAETALPMREAEKRAYGALSEAELEQYLSMTERLTQSLRKEIENV